MISLRLSDEELADVDRLRAATPRGAWVKDLMRCAVYARDELGEPCSLRVVADVEPLPGLERAGGGEPRLAVAAEGHRTGCKCGKCPA